MKEKGKFYSCDRYENVSPLSNIINFIVVNCLQTCTLILFILGLKQHLLCQWIQKSSLLEQIMGKSPEILET